MEKLKQLIEKKRQEKGSLSKGEAATHSSVLNDLMSSLDQESSGKVRGLKPGKGAGQITVAANSENGLKEGVDKAKQLLEDHEGEMKDDSKEDEYDDQDAEGPNHMPTEKEASSFGAQDPELAEPENDEGTELPEHAGSEEALVEGSPEHIAHLKAQLEDAKAHIAHLQKPKSFY